MRAPTADAGDAETVRAAEAVKEGLTELPEEAAAERTDWRPLVMELFTVTL